MSAPKIVFENGIKTPGSTAAPKIVFESGIKTPEAPRNTLLSPAAPTALPTHAPYTLPEVPQVLESYNRAILEGKVSPLELLTMRQEATQAARKESAAAQPVTGTTGARTSGDVSYDISVLSDRRNSLTEELSILSNGTGRFTEEGINRITEIEAELKTIRSQEKDLDAELKRVQEEERQALIDSGEYRKAGFLDVTVNSAKRGYYNSKYGQESYKAMAGQENEKEKYEEILAGEDYKYLPQGVVSEAVSGAAELLGQQFRQWTDPRSLNAGVAGAATGAGIALAAGQAGPQVLLPEEALTVPGGAVAGFMTGMQAGSVAANFEIEAGLAYNEMLENGISEKTAKAIALGVGGVNAALEAVQLDELAKAFKITKSSGATKNFAKALADEIVKRASSVANETLQEVAQEGATIAGTQIGSRLDTGEWAYSKDEVVDRLADTAKSSALSFGVMNLPGTVRNAASQGAGVFLPGSGLDTPVQTQQDAQSAVQAPGQPTAGQNAAVQAQDTAGQNAALGGVEAQNKTASTGEAVMPKVTMADFTDVNSPIWNNVAYDDTVAQSNMMRSTHQEMVAAGEVVQIPDSTMEQVGQSYPDLRTMKKSERTPLLRQKMTELKMSLRQFLNTLKGGSYEFEVNGNVLEAKLYDTGVREVMEKITQDKASMLYHSDEVFQNARYLYSTPDYDGDPNIYRWNYFYTPVQIGEEIVGVRIAVRDVANPQESQIYNWNIKRDATLDGGGRGQGRSSSGVSSVASTEDTHQLLSNGLQLPEAMADDVLAKNTIPQNGDGVKAQSAQSSDGVFLPGSGLDTPVQTQQDTQPTAQAPGQPTAGQNAAVQQDTTGRNAVLGGVEAQNKTASTGETGSTAVNTDPAQHTAAEQAVIESYQKASDEGLVSFYNEMRSKDDQNEAKGSYHLHDVSKRMAADVLELTGKNVSGFKADLDGRQAWHISNDHGENGKADHSMADPNDVSRMQYILDNYDTISKGGTTDAYWEPNPNYPGKQRQAQTVVFSKKVNGTYYVVEAVPITKSKTVKVVSAYMLEEGKTPPGGAGKKTAGQPSRLPDADAPWFTAKTDSASSSPASDPTVPQPAQGVKAQSAQSSDGVFLPGSGLDVETQGRYDEQKEAGINGRGEEATSPVQGVYGADVWGQDRRPDTGAVSGYQTLAGGELQTETARAEPAEWARGHTIEQPLNPASATAENQAKNYYPRVYVVEDTVLKARRPGAWATTSNGIIYISDSLPAELADVVGHHEVVHAVKQQGNEEYQALLADLGEKINYQSGSADQVLTVILNATSKGRSMFDLSLQEQQGVFDELNAVIWGYYKADPENARAQFAEMFKDYDGYIAQLDAVMEGARESVQAQGSAGIFLPGSGLETNQARAATVEEPPVIERRAAEELPMAVDGTERVVETPPMDDSVDGFGQNTVGAAQARFKYQEAPTQSVGDYLFTEQELSEHPELHNQHRVLTDAEGNYIAEEMLANEYDSEVERLQTDEWGKIENIEGHMILEDLVEKARKSGSAEDWAKVTEWKALFDRKGGTEHGQALQGRAQFADSPATITAEAVETLDGENIRKMSDEKKNKILGDIHTQAAALDSIQEGDTASLIALIERNSEIRRTTGLLSKKTAKSMDWALNKVAELYPETAESFLRDVARSQIRSIASDYQKLSPLEAVKNYRVMGMLSKTSTIMRNLVSNNVFDPLESLSNNVGMIADVLLSKATGNRTTALDRSWASKAKRSGSLEGALKSYIQVGLDVNVEGATSRYETGSSRTFKMIGNPLERLLSTWSKFESYTLNTTDEFQKGGIRAETQRGIDQLKAKGKLDTEALPDWAGETAKQRTFQNDGALSGMMVGLRSAGNRLSVKDSRGGSFGAGDLLLPFARVPGNLVAQSANYSPLGLANSFRELTGVLIDAKKGKVSLEKQAQAARDFGRGVTGSALLAAFAALAAKGLIDVAGADDPDKEALEKTQGRTGTQWNLSATMRAFRGESTEWQDGDTLMAIGFLDPINAIMAAGALLADEYEETGKVTTAGVAGASLGSTFQAVLDLPAMSSISDLIDTYTYAEGETVAGKVVNTAADYGASQVSSFLLPNALRGIATGTDDTVRNQYAGETWREDAVNSIKSGIPGLRETLPASLDSFGREKAYTGNDLLDFLNANIMPGQITRYSQTELEKEIERLNAETGDVGAYPDKSAPGSISYDSEKYTLTPEERYAYQQNFGQVAQDLMYAMVESGGYKAATNEEKVQMMSDTLSFANDLAKREILAARGVDYKSSKWEKAYTVVEAGIDFSVYLEYKDQWSEVKEASNASAANSEVRRKIFSDNRLTQEQKSILDETILSDGIYIPKDVDVDYSSGESFTISQMSESAQKRWPGIKEKFSITAEQYVEAWAIYNQDGVSVAEKKAALRELVGATVGNRLYNELGKKLD